MTAVWIALAALAVLCRGARALDRCCARGRRAAGRARASIEHLANDTSADRETGAVRSVQRADLLIDREALEEIWTPAHLERLARTYWRFLTHVTLGLIRVRYSEQGRSVVLLSQPLPAVDLRAAGVRDRRRTRAWCAGASAGGCSWLAAAATAPATCRSRWPAQPGEQSERQTLHVEVAVVNFYPAIASGLSLRLYNVTQSRIHVIVTYGFLRSLARLDLAESVPDRLAAR